MALSLTPAGDPAAAGTPTRIVTGPQQTVLGPSGNIDSLYATVRDSKGLHAYMSNAQTIWYDQLPDGTLTHPRVILRVGAKGSPDQCGVHPVGAVYKATATHWVTFYHGEQANPHQYGGNCYLGPGKRNYTRWSIIQMQTFDAGRTWHKGGRVITQDSELSSWNTNPPPASNRDDVGSPRLVIHGDHLYLFYRAMNRQSRNVWQMSVARATMASLGKPGAWKKYFAPQPTLLNPHPKASFSQPGLGGQQSAIQGLPATARGISWNSYLGSYISVRASQDGIRLYRSEGTDFTRWKPLKQIVPSYGTASPFGKACIPEKTPSFPVAVGYGATIGWTGSSTATGRRFWVYYMIKPKGKCFSERYLVRRQVALDENLATYPKPRVSTGDVTYKVSFSAPHKKVSRHRWTVKSKLTRNGKPWSHRKVTVQANRRSRWVVADQLRSSARGVVTLRGKAKGRYRFHVAKSGDYPAATSRKFKTPRR
ncbi:hypothetical protein [Nocardioides terrisoli]|uniref:hypothetical protein n=1 Tax=Nocardioides terrisoli TaxID=3388267 RepID=UPI00287BA9D9|nr:hypothetical protein [Nocardioides marmorisolisilvae]